MTIATIEFKDMFMASLEAMAEIGTFDSEAERLIDEHFSHTDEPFGIEAARDRVVNRLFDAMMDSGWALFDVDLNGKKQIQRVDAIGAFENDDEALAFVKAKAISGSIRHKEALAEQE